MKKTLCMFAFLVAALLLCTLSFATGTCGWLGGLEHLGLKGITTASMQGDFPEMIFIMFQMTFAIITPGLIVGSFVERMKFSAILLFTALWLVLVYAPMTYWVWGGAVGWQKCSGYLYYCAAL